LNAALVQIAFIWFFTWANILGPAAVGRIQSCTTFLALIPIVGTAALGWLWFSPSVYMAGWNVSGQSGVGAVGATLNFTLWAFIGVESASVSAGVVENPSKNVPIATVGGVVIAAVCYILSSTVVMGMIPNAALLKSSAPFVDAVVIAIGPEAGRIVAGCAALGCLGSLAGWTLLVGQTAKAAADDGLFPSLFAKINAKGVPSSGLALVAVIMSVQVLATMSPTAGSQFGKIASIAVIMTLLPYIYSAVALKVLGWHKMTNREYVFSCAIGLVAAVYSLWAMVGSDGEQTRWSLIFVIATMVFYAMALSHKREVEEGHLRPEGPAPSWIRYVTLGVTILVLAAMFWHSVGRHEGLSLIRRALYPAAAEQRQ
jgi:arginine:agmatine antiporter